METAALVEKWENELHVFPLFHEALGKLSAKSAPSFPQFPQLLLLLYQGEEEENSM